MGEMTVFRGETACFTAFVTWGTSAVAYASTAVPQGIYFVPNAISLVPAAFSPVPVAIAPVPAATAGGARRFHKKRCEFAVDSGEGGRMLPACELVRRSQNSSSRWPLPESCWAAGAIQPRITSRPGVMVKKTSRQSWKMNRPRMRSQKNPQFRQPCRKL